jgi:cytoskeletal protein RodZ
MNKWQAGLLAASMVLASVAQADEKKPVVANDAAPGIKVYRDPATGKLSSTPLEAASQAEQDAQRAANEAMMNGIVRETRPDGTQIDHLNGAGEESIVVERSKDGKLKAHCTDALEAKMNTAQTTQTSSEVTSDDR